jgi:hypothetical protein
MRCINHQFTIMHRLAGNLMTNKLTGLNLPGKRADSEDTKSGQPSLNCREIGGSCGLHSVSNIWSDSIAVASAMMFA